MFVSQLLKCRPVFWIFLLGSLLSASALAEADDEAVRRGEYLIRIAGCNDCHTAGYPEAAGQIPMSEWLKGANVGFQGPWGTSYPTNLRQFISTIDETQWLARARAPMLPPMPWFALRDMSDEDLLAIYLFVRSLGVSGEPAPAPVAPGAAVDTPYIEFYPKNLPTPVTSH